MGRKLTLTIGGWMSSGYGNRDDTSAGCSIDNYILDDNYYYFILPDNWSSKVWKPSLPLKRLFNYIHDENIQPKGSIYSIRCVDKMGRTTKYQIETPYDNVETGKGGLWRGKVERMYVQLKRDGVRFLSPEEEYKIKKTSTKLKKI